MLQKVEVGLKVFDETQVVNSLRVDRKWPERGFFRTGMIFEPVDDNYNPVFVESPDAFNYHNALLKNTSNTWTFEMDLDRNDFEEIEYYVYPYVTIDQPGLPAELWNVLGLEKLEFGLDYLNFPIKMTSRKVRVFKD